MEDKNSILSTKLQIILYKYVIQYLCNKHVMFYVVLVVYFVDYSVCTHVNPFIFFLYIDYRYVHVTRNL